jgi:NADP-dependent 3-hydroxy acid dehydrogenase YdfG
MFIALLVLSFLLSALANDDMKVILISGCSSGIGKSIAIKFADNLQFKVWATMRNIEKWDYPAQSNLIVAEMDVTSDESVNRLVERIIDVDGKIDIVVNNAGYGLAGYLESVEIEEAKNLFDVNVWGVVRLLHATLPHMRRRRSGHVINISSTSGVRGIPGFEIYTGSKFALEGITDSLRYSLYQYNIAITNVNAGPVKTSFTDRFGFFFNNLIQFVKYFKC